MKSARIALSALAAALVLFAAPAANASECSECLERKRAMCATECRKVSADNALRCQNDCARQYCSHRCSADDLLAQSDVQECVPCLDQQFNLCESSCPEGTARVRATCRLECAKARCKPLCVEAKSD